MAERRVAIVTGAGSGVGRALVELLAADGCAVVAVGRSAEPLVSLRDELDGKAEIAILVADVTADSAPSHAAGMAIEQFGRLDWLVNNAGVGKPLPVDETDDATLDFFLDLHLRAPFRFCREALARMADGGAIVNLEIGRAHV